MSRRRPYERQRVLAGLQEARSSRDVLLSYPDKRWFQYLHLKII